MTTKHELFEELEAFDPKWQEHYRSLFEAATAAKVRDLLVQYLETPAGGAYLSHTAGVRDYKAEIEEHQRLVELEQGSLRFNYSNLGTVKGSNW